MSLKDHYWKMFWETAAVCGAILLVWTLVLQFNNMEVLGRRNLWQMILLGGAVVFRMESLVNFHKLEEHLMRINYLITSVLADAALLILFYHFTSGGKTFAGKGWLIFIVYVIAKSLFYLMSYLINFHSAREINKKLKVKNTE
ncbi:hypothetical protein [Spirochaeta isovalerica]|uniref:Uncharacterized protein n=1 Tax=Spirochaeta isovalerica TaxID=150 RepID=A0A841RC75_9SPIO|nr:hypothetical protein [Spirochaeta isovalerica]MBB6480268.1 hypothetical protein [Spirochaeta isovalerica]